MYLCGLIALYYDITSRFFLKLGARKTLTPRFTDSFTDFEKIKWTVLQSRLYMAACLEQIMLLLTLSALRVISIKFLFEISMLCETEWS